MSDPRSAYPQVPSCKIPTPHEHSSFDDPIDCPYTEGRVSSPCMIGQGFDNECQQPAKYAAHWTDNGDDGLLCEDHAALARALPNGPSLHLRTLS